MRTLGDSSTKFSYATHIVPEEDMAGVVPIAGSPQVGHLVVGEVLGIGRHATLETREGITAYLFPGDLIVGVFGNRYATDQYEGYVPEGPVEECDIMSVGGACGTVASRHTKMAAPTRLRVLGLACGADGEPLNTRDYAPPALPHARSAAEVILVVGSSMNAGKTTTAGTIARALTRDGAAVAAAKVTGTAAGKDVRYLTSCGARPVLDFTHAGYPSTYMADTEELLAINRSLLSHLRATGPDFIVVEVADGVVQRETRLLLESREFRAGIDHVVFAATDPLSAESGVRSLREWDLPLRAVSGAVTQSELAMREVADATDVPCFGTEDLMNGALPALLGAARQRIAV